MRRRDALKLAAAALAAPRFASAQPVQTLRFVPSSDLSLLDPVATTAAITRNHAYLVWDTLYGVDDAFTIQPQMLEGHEANADHTDWTLTLREGLRFHDGAPVLGRDVVASIGRWAKRDVFGDALMQATGELSAPTDRTVRFRMKRGFALLPAALSKIPPYMPCIMPERLAATDAFTQVTEIVGSGPFRFLPGERVPGSRAVYEKFSGYVPRPSGRTEQTAGPKIAYVDRVEWITMPDASTVAGALQTGEVDWWESPSPDLQPLLRRNKNIVMEVREKAGYVPILRFNALFPPFDNPAVRRAVLRAVDQSQFMLTYSDDRAMWRDRMGVFPPDTPMATEAGMAGLFGPTDVARAHRELAEAGYKGERVVFMVAGDSLASGMLSPVAEDLFKKIGLNVDYQMVDLGTLYQRRASQKPPEAGGWNCFIIGFNGADLLDPAVSSLVRGNGLKGWYGWPTSAELEALHAAWFEAGDEAAQRAVCERIQLQVWQDAPYVPLGQIFLPTAYSKSVTGMLDGFPKFYNVRKG
jgi:peptide/nickel transport system substrate-binding protein